jgi:integrase/recombinase XerC
MDCKGYVFMLRFSSPCEVFSVKNVKISLNLFLEYLQIEKNYSQYTVVYYQRDIEDFFAFLKEQAIQDVSEVTYSDARLYLTSLHQKNYSRRTVSRKISSLRSFYKFLMREKIVKENPFTLVSLPKKEQRIPNFLYKQELEVLFQVSDLSTPIGQRNHALLELLYATGIRVGECCQINLGDIDFSLGTILVKGKGNKQRYVPFGSFAQEALERYIGDGRKKLAEKTSNDSQRLFLNFRGGPLTPRGVRYILDYLMKQASATIHISPHVLRHTFATHMLNEGADMRTVQELLGHAHLSSTQIYTHVTKEHLRNIYMSHHPRAK